MSRWRRRSRTYSITSICRRYDFRIASTWYGTLAEDIAGCRIIKLVLQPIIENAIIHRRRKPGAWRPDHRQGICEGQPAVFRGHRQQRQQACRSRCCANLKSISTTATRGHLGKSVGIKNVHQRIRLYLLAKKYGIHITSSRQTKGRVWCWNCL